MESESTSLSASLGLDGSLGVSGATAATGAGEDTSLSEQDLQHSLQAHKEYQDLNLTQCLEALTALQVSRPEDPLIAHNLCLVKYLNQEMDLEAMAKELEALYLQVMSGNDVEECEHQALVYNLALTFFLKKNLVRAEQLLRKVNLIILFYDRNSSFHSFTP